jgi:hypothetical protein
MLHCPLLLCFNINTVVTFVATFNWGRLPTIQQEVQQRKLIYMGLYLLIWGEAANLRFMPECLCYIYHHVCMFQTFMRLEKEMRIFLIFLGALFERRGRKRTCTRDLDT